MKYSKLFLAGLQLVVTLLMVTAVTFAWVTVSVSPEVSGIQMSIGGSSVISIAADVTETVDGVVYHYPSEFSDVMQISEYETYTYISELDALMPVSTADGINWFLPTYYEPGDTEVTSGIVYSGELKPIDEFYLDSTLQYANHSNLADYDSLKGNYVYMDFWVTAPMDYDLRISMENVADDDMSQYSGSYAIALPEAVYTVSDEGLGTYSLEESPESMAAIRLGFLVNESSDIDAYALYQKSDGYNSMYTDLKGIYQEVGEIYYFDSNFTIYEPNGNLHPSEEEQLAAIESYGGLASLEETDIYEAGSYVETNPIGIVDGEVSLVDISDILTVQTESTWLDMSIFQKLFTQSVNGNPNDLSLDELETQFYSEHLLGTYINYVEKGLFVTNTASLYAVMDEDGEVTADEFDGLAQSGATDDVIIVSLQANVPQRIRLYIWVEGQDVDCTNGLVTSKIALSIEFAGSNQDFED